MIIGDYYINNFLIVGIVLLLFGGLGFVVVPGGDAGTSEPGQNQSDSYEILVEGEGLKAGSSQTITLVNDGKPVTDVPVLLDGEEVGTTGTDGSVAVDVPDQSTVTVSASSSQVNVEKTFEVEASEGDGSDEDQSEEDSSEDSSDDETGDEGSQDGENGTDDSGNQGTDNETIEPSINRLTPENHQLDSPEFEASYELAGSNASYRISLNNEEKALGELDGEKTVSEQLSMPVNGTVGLKTEIIRDESVLASENFTVNYTTDSGSDESSGDNDSDGDTGSDPADVTAELSAPSSVQVDNQVQLDASGSSGDIVNYTWRLGDGTTDTTESATFTHTYSSEGTYDIKVTVNGENDTEDNASTALEVQDLQEPIINLENPVDGYETNQASINYEFEVNNSLSSSEYSILIDGSSKVSGGLNQGNNTVQQTVEVPETVFNTSIQVTQNGETYTSGKRTVNTSEAGTPQPDYSLNSPQEGDTIETLDSQTSVEFEYEITDRKWATSANLTVTRDGNKVEERPVSVASGTYTEQVSGLEPGSYSYEIELIDGDTTDSKSKAFSIQQETLSNDVSVISPDGTSDDPEVLEVFDVKFELAVEHETDVTLNASVKPINDLQRSFEDCENGEKTTTTISYEGGEVVYSHSSTLNGAGEYNQSFNKTHYIEGIYKWRSELINGDGEVISTSAYSHYNVTDQPDLAAEGSCDGQSQ